MRRSLLSFATFLVLTTASLAQTPDPAASPARIRVGDELQVYVFGEPALTGPVIVQTDGAIYVPRVGRIVAAGLTTVQAQDVLLAKLRKILVSPTATLSLSRQRGNSVFVVGAKSSVIPYTPETDLRQVLAASQVNGDLDLLQVSVFRAGRRIAAFPAIDLTNGRSTFKGNLRPDDFVVFESKPFIRVWVEGTVAKPGEHRLFEGDDVYRAIADAGDLAGDPASTRPRLRSDYVVTVRRGPEIITVPLVQPTGQKPVRLETGDTVTVEPPTEIRVTFTGYARNPGERYYKGGTSLATAVGAEGGAANAAGSAVESEGSLRSVILFHDGVASFHDLSPRPTGPIGEQGPTLGDGDVVFIPRNERLIYVFGAVNRSGRLQLEDNRTYRLADAVAEAGAAGNGALNRVSIGRPGTNGKLELKTYRLDKFIRDGDTTQNPVLRPDDVVYVDTTRGVTFQTAITAISAALLLDSLTHARL